MTHHSLLALAKCIVGQHGESWCLLGETFPKIQLMPWMIFFLWPWVCQLGNPHYLFLACAPTFRHNPLKRVLAPRNGRVVIKCRPKGAPKPTFTWSKDTELLSNSTRWEETFSSLALGLTVIQSQRSKVILFFTIPLSNRSFKQNIFIFRLLLHLATSSSSGSLDGLIC